MNFYQFHLGDFEKEAAHLTGVEEGMYFRMIRRYLNTEAPLPNDAKQIKRLLRAHTPDELKAVDTLLGEFFVQSTDGWHNARCDQTIAKYLAQVPKRVNEAERQRRHRDLRKGLFEELRSHDIVPSFNITMAELKATVEDTRKSRNALHVTPVTRTATATQYPIPNTQIAAHTAPTHTSGTYTAESLDGARACRLMREAGVPLQQLNSHHDALISALADGITPEALAETAREAIGKGIESPFAWAISTTRRRRNDALRQLLEGGIHVRPITHAEPRPSPGDRIRAIARQHEAAGAFADEGGLRNLVQDG